MKQYFKQFNFYTILFLLLTCLCPVAVRADETRNIFFPTKKTVTFVDDFGSARPGGRSHEANDLIGEKMMPLYAAVDGWISDIEIPEASWGYALAIKDFDSYTYHYLHINNDTPGTNDGNGGAINAYAEGIFRGAKVIKGQLIGWMGDSGNAENVGSHLHFEIRRPDGVAINPYLSLISARDAGYPETSKVDDINIDKGFILVEDALCISGSLIKSFDNSAVYYCGADGKRHVFVNEKTYFSWYQDFFAVKTISNKELADIPLGKNVTYRPGVKLLMAQSGTRIYTVEKDGVLRWIKTEEKLAEFFGIDWKKKIDIIPDAFFTNYIISDPIL